MTAPRFAKHLLASALLLACLPLQAQESFLVYVTNEDSNDVTVIDGETHAVVDTIPIGKRRAA